MIRWVESAQAVQQPVHTYIETPLGELVAVAGVLEGRQALIGVWFVGQRHFPASSVVGSEDVSGNPLLGEVRTQITQWFDGERVDFHVPLAITDDAGALRVRVWRALADIPYGITTTYGALAQKLGNKSMAQAVGQAVGRNPWTLIVPCHRVLGANGSLTGYAGGVERKRLLLVREGVLFPDVSGVGQ